MTNFMKCLERIDLPETWGTTPVKQEVKVHEGLITLDPSKDPDPYGHHNMPLSYRLHCMGWPEGLS